LNILYVANLGTNRASGVNVVVPQHMKYQSEYANIGFYNFQKTSMIIDSNVTIISNGEHSEFNIEKFPEPFNNPDIVIIHDIFSSLKFCKVAKILNKIKIPYIIVPHGCFTHNAMKRRKLRKVLAINTVLRNLVYKATAIQFLSDAEMKSSYININPIIIPNGTIIPKNVELKKSDSNKISFIYIGRKDIYYKGIDLLLKACKLAENAMRKYGATLTLYGPDRKGSFIEIEKMISEYKIGDFVFNKEGVFEQEKDEVLRNSSVFVLTSRTEGQPIALLEACAYGLPVLITPGTNVADEVIKFNCGWVANLSAESIAEKLTYIINHQEEIQNISRNAHKYVSSEYNWEVVSKKAVNQYKIIKNKNS